MYTPLIASNYMEQNNIGQFKGFLMMSPMFTLPDLMIPSENSNVVLSLGSHDIVSSQKYRKFIEFEYRNQFEEPVVIFERDNVKEDNSKTNLLKYKFKGYNSYLYVLYSIGSGGWYPALDLHTEMAAATEYTENGDLYSSAMNVFYTNNSQEVSVMNIFMDIMDGRYDDI